MIQIVYYTLLAILAFGTGFCLVLLSGKQIKGWIQLSLVLGVSILTVIIFWISSVSKKGIRPYAIPIFIIIICALLIALFRKWSTAKEYIKSVTKIDMACIAICFAAGMLPLTIYVLYGAQYPYCDGYTYVCIADYLADAGYNVKVNANDMMLHPWLSQVYLYQEYNLRIGAQMLLAFASCLFDVELSIELFLPISALSVMLCGISVWFFCDAMKVQKEAGVWAVTLMCFNLSIIQWCSMYGFLPQILGSALFLAAIASIINIESWHKKPVWEIASAAIIIAGFALVYSEMVPFFVLTIGLVAVSLIYKNRKNSIPILLNYIYVALASVLLIIPYFAGMISAILEQLGAVVGSNQNFDVFTYLSYIFSTVPALYNFRENQVTPYLLAAEIFTLLLLGATIRGAKKTEKSFVKKGFLLSIPYGAMALYFVFFTKNPFTGGRINTWSLFKLVQYYFVLLIPFIAVFLFNYIRGKKASRICSFIFILVFICYNGYNGIKYSESLTDVMKAYVGENTKPIDEYYKLRDLYNDSAKTISLVGIPNKHRQMVTYFLKETQLISDWKTDDYYNIIPADMEVTALPDSILKYEVENENATAGLIEESNTIVFGKGFYSEERDTNRVWRWGGKEAELSIESVSADKEYVELQFEIYPYNTEEKQTVDIFDVSNKLIKSIEIEPNAVLQETIKVKPNTGSIRFICSGEGTQAGDNDNRELAFAISNYQVN